MSEWIRITECSNIPPREGRTTTVGDRQIAIFNLGPSTRLGTGDRFLAVDNRCPHRGGPLGDGIIAGDSVVCPLHAWKINLETGTVQRPAGSPACVRAYETRVADGVILIALPSSSSNSSGSPGTSVPGEGQAA
jgi:NAD(P)H-dependent nitrite reductase small subunit